MVEPVSIVANCQLPANKNLVLRESPATWGDLLIFDSHSTVVWSMKKEKRPDPHMAYMGVRRASKADFENADEFELVVDTAVAIEKLQSNIQHFLFDDLLGMFAHIYVILKGIDMPEVVLWPAHAEQAGQKWSFHRNIFDLLAPNRHLMLVTTKKVLIKKTLYTQRDQAVMWNGHNFEWRKDLKGVPPEPHLGHIQVILDELRGALDRDFSRTKKLSVSPLCLPAKKGESAERLFLMRVGLHGKRVLRNTVEYEKLLESMGYAGWNPMQCESLTQRWAVLSKAKVVIAQFGSDMCNVLWMQRGATVIDVVHPGASYTDKHMPGDWNYGFFEAVAEALGIHHEAIFAGERRTGPHDVIAVREGHNFRLLDGSMIYVNRSTPGTRPLPFPPHELIYQQPSRPITHIDGKPFSKINISRATTFMEKPGSAFYLFSYGVDWVVDLIEVRKQLNWIEAKMRADVAGAEAADERTSTFASGVLAKHT